jgi:two-component system KDP operon response regulator KdpE
MVLLVDDDPDQLKLRRMNLEMHGYRVGTAASVEAAMLAVANDHPHIVLMDLHLPGLGEGRELIRRLKSIDPGVHIVVLSGCPEELDPFPETRLVDRCLRKPARSEQLVRTVKRLAGGA